MWQTVLAQFPIPLSHYGGNATSAPKMASELLQIFGRTALMHSGIVKKFAFEEFKQKYNAIVKNDTEQWKPLEMVMRALMTQLDASGAVNLYTFAFKHSLNGVAEVAGSCLSDANRKLKENVSHRLRVLYGD
jgi:hypothetical protein